jgi:hypothetical protein
MRFLLGRRWPALLVLAVVLGGLVGLSGQRTPRRAATFGTEPTGAMPTGAAVDALSSTWFCAAGTATAGAPLNLSVVIANAAPEARTASVTWFPRDAAAVNRSVQVPANDVVILVATDVLDAPTVSALVEIDGGGVAVEHSVAGPSGSGVAPCSTEASGEWYLPNGVTERDAREVLAVFNPFPADAVVDLSFSTDTGRVNPPAGQGLPIPARSTVYVNVQDIVRRRAIAAAEVVARQGEVVVDRVQLFDGSLGRRGVGLTLAAPRGAVRWEFPDGLSQPPTVLESWHVYNPNDTDAEITLSVDPDRGDPPGPLDLTVPARTQVRVTAEEAGVVAGVAHAVTIESQNGVSIVAERTVDLRAPSTRVGWSSTLGSTTTASDWLFAAGEAGARSDEWIVVRNLDDEEVTVSVAALASGVRLPIEDLQDRTVPAGGRLALRLGDHIQRFPLPVLVRASGAVIVERAVYGVGRVGVSSTLGIPFR